MALPFSASFIALLTFSSSDFAGGVLQNGQMSFSPLSSIAWTQPSQPSDPKCKAWFQSNCNLDKPFGFPDFVRFSWGPSKKILKEEDEESGPMIRWEADEEEDEVGQSSLDAFVVSKKSTEGKGRKSGNLEDLRRKKARLGIYNELGLAKVTKFVEAAY